MGSEQPSHEDETRNLPAANGADSEDSESESWSHEFPSASEVQVVGPVRVVNGDKGPSRKAEKRVDRIERCREECKEDPYLFEGGYQRIKNVLYVQENPVYRAALEDWNRKKEESEADIADYKNQKNELNGQVYNIVGFFSVYLGVVLTAVSQLASGTGDKCRKTWVPVLLSVIAASGTFYALHRKFQALQKAEGLTTDSVALRNFYQDKIEDLREHGKHFRFYKVYPKKLHSKSRQDNIWFTKVAGLLSVVLVTGVFVLSYFVILCDTLLI